MSEVNNMLGPMSHDQTENTTQLCKAAKGDANEAESEQRNQRDFDIPKSAQACSAPGDCVEPGREDN